MNPLALFLALLLLSQPTWAELAECAGHGRTPPETAVPPHGREAGARSPRVFPEWRPAKRADCPKDASLETELRALLATGRRDRAASPEFLDALEQLLARHAGKGGASPSDRLPVVPDFRDPSWPAGWEAVDASVWRFGDGVAEQTRSWANKRFVLSYAPGRNWRDYSATFRCESPSWMTPPSRSAAVLYFRYRGVDDTFSFWLDGAGDIALISFEKGRPLRLMARVPADPAIIRDGKPWTVKVKGDEIEVWHEGVRWLQTTDRAHPAGTVGVESVHVPMRFSEIRVE